MYNKIAGVYFSATDNTKKSVSAMVECADTEKIFIDVTDDKPVQPVCFDSLTFVIFGAPVYGGRLPYIARQRFENFKGNGTKCAIVATYGNRDYDDALLEMKDLFEKQGFEVMGAAALVCKHTYGEIQTDRPDVNDLNNDKEFIKKVLEKDIKTQLPIKGNHPYKEAMLRGKFKPLTNDNCIKCGLCVKKCPVGAIDKDCVTVNDKCLSCLRCVKLCPKKAKNLDYDDYIEFAKLFTEKLKLRKENEYFV